jgi:hypothetical protein
MMIYDYNNDEQKDCEKTSRASYNNLKKITKQQSLRACEAIQEKSMKQPAAYIATNKRRETYDRKICAKTLLFNLGCFVNSQ